MARIIIVGAGIGGLAATALLEQAGFDVCTIERAPRFGEVGAGVQLGPNATRVLRRLGLDEEIRALGVTPAHVSWVRWQDGKALATMSMADIESRFGTPYLTMYRPDLVGVLSSRVSTAQVRLGVAVSAVTESGGRPAVELDDGTIEIGDLIVGADGIHSGVRAQTVGDTAPRFSGMSAYRARIARDELDFDDVVRNWMGPDRHLVAYPVGAGSAYLNIVAVVPDQEPSAESWTMPGSADELRGQFDGWCDHVQRIVGAVRDPVYRWALYDRDPLAHWSTATTTLLGDACHPMLPFFAQGAAQAIGDAAALTQALSTAPDDLTSALKRYEHARLDHTARIQRLSWENNVVYHLPDGPAQQERDAMLSRSSAIDTFSWLYGNDPFALSD
ncbi:FAD-dependent monooxygenase [Mycobacterium sp. AZCC_0083]|uniref:FAD-dependent monooxygenase n=1 Tax=Mycobacterium sp. AZCC_0083 TaxID=2735882 RepID=UPI001613F2FE|nr:FAD-dependent monooxygenase [Mycobacterium sp. AZCC_0083]MBB5168521.1 salicylate hydroxylase [Mycobacterium sp. AZCC_0083]